MFLKNAWYVAAWEREVKDRPLAVTLLDEDVVLYRQTNGAAVALEDACVHRKLPLSLGRVRGDHLECGYHGLTFDATGRCVRIPCSEHIPTQARVRSYPLVSKYGLLWIWMGAPDLADSSTIMDVAHWGDPNWGVTSGDAMTVDCNYLLLTDNLLDPSHVAWVHPTSFAGADCDTQAVDVSVTDLGVIASRWMRSVLVAPLYVPFVAFEGLCDRLQHYEVRYPSHALIRAIFVPAGVAGPEAEGHPSAFIMDSYNFLTPVTGGKTRYFWFQMRNAFPEDDRLTTLMEQGVRGAFEEDRAILSAVQRGMERSRTSHISIPIDTAPTRFRRRLNTAISAERGLPNGANSFPG